VLTVLRRLISRVPGYYACPKPGCDGSIKKGKKVCRRCGTRVKP
jgi:hypothetical protein